MSKKKKYPNYANMMSDIALPAPELEKLIYVAFIVYQDPSNITFLGRSEVSPRFKTGREVIAWINKQAFDLDFTIFKTSKENAILEGRKLKGEDLNARI